MSDIKEASQNSADISDLAAHGRAMGIFRSVAMVVGFVLWFLTIVLVAVFVPYENNRISFNTVGLWSVIAMTATLCMNFYMTVQSKKFSEHFQKSGKMLERSSSNQVNIIKSLCSNFTAAYYIDLVTGDIDFLSLTDRIVHYMGKEYSEKHSYEWYVQSYCDRIVDPTYKDEFIRELSRENLKDKLSTRDYYTYIYIGDKNGRPNYFEMKVTKCDGSNTKLIVGFADVDAEVREKKDSTAAYKTALKQAEKANNTKNIFLSNVSKELLTPLNEISGNASMVAAEAEAIPGLKENAERIVSSAERMSFLINDIVDISAIESQDVEFYDAPMNLKEVVEEAVEANSAQAEARNIAVAVVNDITHTDVIGDRARFYSIIKRLLDYSIDFSDKGSSLLVEAKEVGTLNGKAHFEVSIAGDSLSVDESSISEVYDTFFNEAESDGGHISATGTGFLISKCILELMKGRLDIKGQGSGGTRLVITINFKLDDDANKYLT
ncbi:MAG: HAMP domain-containing histidine kinase [Lachnospiraceae bacterium]|nr:HAMP domain-containing histidine kinase [Lachnospiraceae bacterium]